MQQQINLFTALPKAAEVKLPARQMMLILMIFFGALCGYSGIEQLRLRSNKNYINVLNKNKTDLESQLLLLNAKKTRLATESDIKIKVDELRRKLITKEQLHLSLKEIHHNNVKGFSPFLISLAQRSNPNVWLKEILITQAGGDVELLGSAVSGAQVTLYLEALSKTEAFANKRFIVVEIAKDDENPNIVNFLASTKPRVRDE